MNTEFIGFRPTMYIDLVDHDDSGTKIRKNMLMFGCMINN